MFARWGRSWELVKASWAVLRSDKELVVFPIISAIGCFLVSITFFLPMLATGALDSVGRRGAGGIGPAQMIILFLFYLVTYTVIIFCSSALVGAAVIRLDGGDPSLSDGFKVAQSRLPQILGYALISATVGLVLQLLSNAARNNRNIVLAIIGQIVVGIAGAAWSIATFLAVPVLVIEGVGPIEAIKRSTALLKKTWGEQIIGDLSIGGIFGLMTLGVILVAMLLGFLFMNTPALLILVIIVAIVAVMAISIVGSALNAIFRVALYRYAHDGKTSEFFQTEMIQSAFKADTPKKGIFS
jgi:hypothetical protein